MRKPTVAALTAIIVLVSIAINPLIGINGQGTNRAGGIITVDTTWTQNNSPYNLISDLFVNPGVTLTIEPGVTVSYNGYNFYVNGTLNAQGTETQKIVFNAGKKWDGVGPESHTWLGGSSKVSHSTLIGRIVLKGDVEVSNNFIDGEISIQKGTPIISNNYINGSMFASGIDYYYPDLGNHAQLNAIISDNEIANCWRGIAVNAGDKASITRNYFHNNSWAIVTGCSNYDDVRGADSTIINNTIKDNTGGITIIGQKSPIITGNNIERNKDFSLSAAASAGDDNVSQVWGTNSQDATYNWWGTTDPAAISKSIIDHNDNSPSGTVTFTPYLTEPNSNAMPNSLSIPNSQTPSTTEPITFIQSITNGSVLSTEINFDNATGQQTTTYVSDHITTTLPNTPQAGHVLVAAISYNILSNGPSPSNVSLVMQRGVSWSHQVSTFNNAYGDGTEIWFGIVNQSADTTTNFFLGGLGKIGAFIVSVVVCEYSGVATVSPLDQTATNSGFGSSADTGTTPMTTAPNELWIGALHYYCSTPQVEPKNGFRMIGGNPDSTGGRMSTALLEKIVDAEGKASTGTSEYASPSNWQGCIATFFAADPTSNGDSNPARPSDPALEFTCQGTTSVALKVDIRGNLTIDGVGVPNQPILFYYSVNNGSTMNELTSVTTDASGGFSALWMPQVTGNYLIKAVWGGNEDYPALSTTVNFALTPSDSESFFSINSNSTLSSLSFDSTTRKLSFTVSGPTGTSGYVEVYLPKTLMSDIAGLKVDLDGTAVAYTYQSQGDVWLVSFTYHHSIHQVTVNLNGQPQIDGSLVGFILLIAVAAPLAVALTVIATKRNKNKQN